MAYPDWLAESLRVVPCMTCGNVIGVGDITMVGGSVKLSVGPFPGFLRLIVELRCGKCRAMHRVEQDRGDDEIVEVLAAHLALAEPPETSGKTDKLWVPFDDDDDEPPKPHVRIDARNLFDTPLHEADIKRFSRLLARVSFRRDSKTWLAWLQRLRIDPDATDEER